MGKHHGQNNIVRGRGGGQFLQVSRCPIMALVLESRLICTCLKSFGRGCSYAARKVATGLLVTRVQLNSWVAVSLFEL